MKGIHAHSHGGGAPWPLQGKDSSWGLKRQRERLKVDRAPFGWALPSPGDLVAHTHEAPFALSVILHGRFGDCGDEPFGLVFVSPCLKPLERTRAKLWSVLNVELGFESRAMKRHIACGSSALVHGWIGALEDNKTREVMGDALLNGARVNQRSGHWNDEQNFGGAWGPVNRGGPHCGLPGAIVDGGGMKGGDVQALNVTLLINKACRPCSGGTSEDAKHRSKAEEYTLMAQTAVIHTIHTGFVQVRKRCDAIASLWTGATS